MRLLHQYAVPTSKAGCSNRTNSVCIDCLSSWKMRAETRPTATSDQGSSLQPTRTTSCHSSARATQRCTSAPGGCRTAVDRPDLSQAVQTRVEPLRAPHGLLGFSSSHGSTSSAAATLASQSVVAAFVPFATSYICERLTSAKSARVWSCWPFASASRRRLSPTTFRSRSSSRLGSTHRSLRTRTD